MSESQPILARGSRICSVEPAAEVNIRTRITVVPGVFSGVAAMGVVALAHYEAALRHAVATESPDAVFVAVCDGRRSLTATSIMAPGSRRILGRHILADLRVDASDLSLRHLAIAVSPASTARSPLVRIWDLATGVPFQTEDGLTAEAVTSEGPCFVTLGSLHIAVIPLGVLPRPELPLGTRALWDALPDRELIPRLAEGTRKVRPIRPSTVARVSAAGDEACRTRITKSSGPVAPSELSCSEQEAIGTLFIRGGGLAIFCHIGADALDRGILLGRYARCHEQFETDAISRVHLLIARVGTEVMAIDTASTNGSTLTDDGGLFDAITLDGDTVMQLGDAATVAWSPRNVARA